MAAYVANPADSSHPADTDYALVGAAELRALKAYIATLSNLTQNNFNFWTGFRNKLRNGNGKINQRAITSGTAAGIWIADGWFAEASVATITTTVANNLANNPSKTGGVGLGLSNGAVVKAVLAATDGLGMQQKIEGTVFADLMWGTIFAKPLTVSFVAYASQATTVPVAIRNGAANRSYATPVALAAGAGLYSVTIPGDITGTWPTDNTAAAIFTLYGAIGSTFVAPAANIWTAGNYSSCPGVSNICDTANRYVVFSDIQAEMGTVMTPYELRDDELRRNQRYFWKSYAQPVAPGTAGATGALFVPSQGACNYLGASWTLPVTMRATGGTMTIYNPSSGAVGTGSLDGTAKAMIGNAYESSISAYINNIAGVANQFLTLHATVATEL